MDAFEKLLIVAVTIGILFMIGLQVSEDIGNTKERIVVEDMGGEKVFNDSARQIVALCKKELTKGLHIIEKFKSCEGDLFVGVKDEDGTIYRGYLQNEGIKEK